MKTHTSNFKNKIKEFGRQLDSIITYELNGETIELGVNELNSITPHYEGSILKSVMKQLDIDTNQEIPVGTEINYKFGLKTGTDEETHEPVYEYIDFGNYIVYSSEKQEDILSYKIVCYDKMLYTMKDYEAMDIIYPITIRNYIQAICDILGLTFANGEDEFANYDKEIPGELYIDNEGNSLGYTYRDVMDELAQVTASTICINDDDELEIRYITDTEDTINEEYLKNVNVNFGEKYGSVNTIVLSRSAESDNVYYPATIPENPIEIKIKDNQIMNGNDRSDYLPDIYEKLNGLEFYINDFSSTGICYYDLCDRYTVSIDGTDYSCIMLNDEINITQGLEEQIHTDKLEESTTDYTKADETDRRINQTTLIVNKQQGEISSLVSQQNETSTLLSQTIQNVNSIQNLFQITGGNNLIKDSQKLLNDEGLWEYGEPSTFSFFPSSSKYPSSSKNPIEYYYNNSTYVGGYDATLIGKTVAIAKLGISNGKMKTTANNITGLMVNAMYTLSYKITNEANTNTKIRLIGNGNVVYDQAFGEPMNMEEISFSFITQTSNYVLEIQSTSSSDNFVYIYDLMLNKGDKQSWEPASGEIVSTVIKLSQLGIQVYSTGSEIATLMTSEGFDVRRFQNGTMYEIVTEFNKDGFISKKGILEQLEIGNYEYKIINYRGNETFILYKKESDS